MLVSRYPVRDSVDGAVQELPSSVKDVFALRRTASPLLSVDVSGVEAIAHLFMAEEIEFDIVPNEVDSEERFVVLLSLLKTLGELLGKTAVLSHENSPELVLLRYDPPASAFWASPENVILR